VPGQERLLAVWAARIVIARRPEVKKAPVKVSADVLLPVGVEAAWARLLQWERQPEWMVDAASVRVASAQREGAGVLIAVRTKIFGLPLLTDVLEITEWDPPRRFVMVRRGFVRGRGEWRLEPERDGARFTWSEELTVPIPVLGELALAAYRPLMRGLMRRSLANLAGMLR
jgi:hypothetical protein